VGDYWNILQEEVLTDSDSWHNYTDINFITSPAGSSDHLHGYSSNYGQTGWSGAPTIYLSNGCVIREGHILLNRFYLEGATRTAKKHVACRMVGHLLGLSANPNATNTCMNSSILNAPFPSSTDRDLINRLY
jgi:hypothetical protein